MNKISPFTTLLLKALPVGLAVGLFLITAQAIVAHSKPTLPLSTSQWGGWEDFDTWDFDNATDLQDWTLLDKSDNDGGTYLWTESTYTSTTGAQSVRPLNSMWAGTLATLNLPYPANLDTWMIYSFTVPATKIWGTQLAFDWWLDSAGLGDALSVLTSTNGLTFTTAWEQSGPMERWYTDTAVPLSHKGYSGVYYIAFRFQSNDDEQSGSGPYLDHVRLQYNYGYSVYLPLIMKRWPPIPASPILNPISNDDYDGDYAVVWEPVDLATTYVLQESDDPDFTSPRTFSAQVTPHRSIVDNPGGTHYHTYYYRVKGSNSIPGGGDGLWSNVVSTTVYALPEAPVLNQIDNPYQLSPYTVLWDAGTAADSYVLQEAITNSFTNTVQIYSGSALSHTISNNNTGTYFYRTKSVNPRASSNWSNVVSTTVVSRQDDFNDPSTGWAARRTSAPSLDSTIVTYSSGRLITELADKYDSSIISPMYQAPPPPYSIRMTTRIINKANLTSYGIVFGGNEGTHCSIDRSNAGDPNGCFFHYYRLNVTWGGFFKYQVKRIDYHEAARGDGRGAAILGKESPSVDDLTDQDGWNNWEFRVYDWGFELYVNNYRLGWTYDKRYIRDPLYGILLTTNEYNNSKWAHAYFYVTPISPVPSPSPESGYQVPGTDWYQPLR